MSEQISAALSSIVNRFRIEPSFLIAKGGITASDIATKGLGVKKAVVLGQAAPGVPVWKLGEECKFSNMPYIIFPGNVGENDTLYNMVKILQG